MNSKNLDKIKNASDRELLEMQTYSALNQERHLDRISKNVAFFFWATVISAGLYLMFLATQQ